MAFKVFDLECEHKHVFEGWFSSHEDFEAQKARALISCPFCSSTQVEKKLSSPRLNLAGGNKAPPSEAVPASLQAALKQWRAYVNASENVGSRFVEEARKIHEGEAPERAIRGTATAQERESLLEEGIAVAPIPDWLDDEKLQ